MSKKKEPDFTLVVLGKGEDGQKKKVFKQGITLTLATSREPLRREEKPSEVKRKRNEVM